MIDTAMGLSLAARIASTTGRPGPPAEIFLKHGISLARYAARISTRKPLERREAAPPRKPTPDQRRAVRTAAKPSNVIPGPFAGIAS